MASIDYETLRHECREKFLLVLRYPNLRYSFFIYLLVDDRNIALSSSHMTKHHRRQRSAGTKK